MRIRSSINFLLACVIAATAPVVAFQAKSPKLGDSKVNPKDGLTYLWIPPGFAHGFCTLSPVADVLYHCSALYAPEDEHGVLWSDESIGISWPVRDPILSPKDQRYGGLGSSTADLPRYTR